MCVGAFYFLRNLIIFFFYKYKKRERVAQRPHMINPISSPKITPLDECQESLVFYTDSNELDHWIEMKRKNDTILNRLNLTVTDRDVRMMWWALKFFTWVIPFGYLGTSTPHHWWGPCLWIIFIYYKLLLVKRWFVLADVYPRWSRIIFVSIITSFTTLA